MTVAASSSTAAATRAARRPARPILVGEANASLLPSEAHLALFPLPRGSAGARLCSAILQLAPEEYVTRFSRANLCRGRWSAADARRSAQRLLADLRRDGGGTVVALGPRVAAALGARGAEMFSAADLGDGVRLIVIPHPSSRSRSWSAPRAAEQARRLFRREGLLPS